MTECFHLDDRSYLSFRDLIQNRMGIVIGEKRREILARALTECLKHENCADLEKLFLSLEVSKTDSDLWDRLVKRLTICETYFFRHLEQINSLRENILPDLIARHWTDRTLYLWSAGCASGEEPYTLAILLRQLLPDIERWRILILATDINRQALARAAAGRYREWSFRETDPDTRQNYFTREGDEFILDPAVQKMVTFSYLNLAEDTYPSLQNKTSRLDLILCRNVSIYLPGHVARQIAGRFYRCLSPGGWLMVGPSETHPEVYSEFQMLFFYGSVVYQKVGAAPPSPTPQGGGCDAAGGNTNPVQTVKGLSVPPRGYPYPLIIKGDAVPSELSASLYDPGAFPFMAPCKKQPPPALRVEIDHYKQGEALMKQCRYEEARQSFLSCLALDGDSAQAQYMMAHLEANTGRLDEALRWAEQALQGDPLRSEIHYMLAVIHQAQEKNEEAVAYLRKVIYLDPHFVLAHFNLFHMLERTGKSGEAERHRTLAVRLASKMPPDMTLPGSDDLTAEQFLTMARITAKAADSHTRGKA